MTRSASKASKPSKPSRPAWNSWLVGSRTAAFWDSPESEIAAEFVRRVKSSRLSIVAIAKTLGVSKQRLFKLCDAGECDADMAVRLARFFENEPEFWFELAGRVALPRARRLVGSEALKAIVPFSKLVGKTGPAAD